MAVARQITERQREALQAFERRLKQELGWSRSAWAREAGVTEGSIRQFLAGRSNSLHPETLRSLAQAASRGLGRKVSSWEMLGQEGGVEMWGQVEGTGAVQAPASLERVPAPPGDDDPDALLALRVSGESLAPWASSGDILFVSRHEDTPPEQALDCRCVVTTRSGETLVRTLRRGSAPGRYDLAGPTGVVDRRDVEIVECRRVLHQSFAPPRSAAH